MTDPKPSGSDNVRSPGFLTRRDFLRFVAGVGIAGWVGSSILDNLGEARLVRQTRKMMGTIVNLSLIAPGRKGAEEAAAAIDACFDRMAALEALLSRFQADSQVSQLNRFGALEKPHPAMLELVRQSTSISELSSGLFDITILPVLSHYQRAQALEGSLPTASELEAARRNVDYRRLSVSDHQLAFSEPGMAVTLDGIAKGYIVDQGLSLLRQRGFRDVLVEAGGDLVAAGQPDYGRSWKIGIQSPRGDQGDLIAELELMDEAVATSGDYLQPFTKDFSQHHILNPHTGCSSAALSSATVIASNLAQADALATTLMVLEPEKGLELVKRLGLRAVLITKGGTILKA